MITDEAVAEFVSLTNASPDEARGYLEMTGGDLQQSVELFLEMGGGGGGGPPAPQAARPAPAPVPRPGPGQGQVVDADVAAEVAAAAAAAGIDPSSITGMPDAPMHDAEVRAPIAAFQDQIIDTQLENRRMREAINADSAAMSRRMTFDRPADLAGAGSGDEPGEGGGGSSGQAINQLFAAPSYNEAEPFYATIEKAKAQDKWVLVNIQQAEVFASHALNRDVWSDDTIRDVVQGSFLFWQRDDKSTEGDQFCQYYSCGHQLPHICVIDPRTKRCVKAWDGRKWCESHAAAEYLFGFLDSFSLSRSPPAMSPAASPGLKPQEAPTGSSGDVQMTGLDAPMEPAELEEAAPEPAEPQEPVAAMPEEPAEGAECLKVSFRLPSGQRIQRRFLPSDTLEQMFNVASAISETPPSRVDLNTQFPKRSLRDVGLQVLMKDAEVAGSMVLVNIRSA